MVNPPFSDLPLQPDGPHGNAWGLYGPKDELGSLNRLTPQTTIEAMKEVVYGIRISTDLPLDQPGVPCFGRQPFHQHIFHKAPRTVNDDILTLNTQSSTQWDGFRHFGYQDEKLYYNGCKQEEIHQTSRNGIQVWTENGGVIGRGVLLDYYSWATAQGKNINPLETALITAPELSEVASTQGVSFKPGDILLVRTGFRKAFQSLAANEAAAYTETKAPSPNAKILPSIPSIGLKSCEETLKWIWGNEFSAVAGDQPAFEALPFQSKEFMLHEWLLAGWGMPIGEFFDLEALAEECGKRGKWSFLFSSVPLKVPGGVASPPNGIAIL